MEKEFQKIIKEKELTNEQLKEMVCDLIKLVPESKYSRINYIINKDTLVEDLSFDEIIKIIDELIEDAENERYCDTSYYDYHLDEEIVEGDESWIDEIDRAFRGIKGLMNKKQYQEAMIAYGRIFDITEGNYEEN